jgi:hypothetical protein
MVYAWSIFRTPLEQDLGLGATASLLPFTVALVSYSGMMPLAGRRVATMGAVVVALGYMRASAAGSIQELVLAYGVVAGLVFTAYGVGALVGTLITGQLRDWLGTYSAAFYPLPGLAAADIVLAAKLLPGASRS